MTRHDNAGLSVLIPAYNHCCTPLVDSIVRQISGMEDANGGYGYEVVIGDDGSTRADTKDANRDIAGKKYCRYFETGQNIGRAAMRNRLAEAARYDTLLFLDCDVEIDKPDFIKECHDTRLLADVVVGSLRFNDGGGRFTANLRYRYETRYAAGHATNKRNGDRYAAFRTTNFMIRKAVITAHPFDESFAGYGYEDTLLGKELMAAGATLTHTDNYATISDYDDNATFVWKTEQSLATLSEHATQLEGFSKILKAWHMIDTLHATWPVRIAARILMPAIRRQITGNRPRLWLYDLYKLLYFTATHKGHMATCG